VGRKQRIKGRLDFLKIKNDVKKKRMRSLNVLSFFML
jgi:hypothetical protein